MDTASPVCTCGQVPIDHCSSGVVEWHNKVRYQWSPPPPGRVIHSLPRPENSIMWVGAFWGVWATKWKPTSCPGVLDCHWHSCQIFPQQQKFWENIYHIVMKCQDPRISGHSWDIQTDAWVKNGEEVNERSFKELLLGEKFRAKLRLFLRKINLAI